MASALFAALALISLPIIQNLAGFTQARLAAGEVAAALGQARMYAIRYQVNVAVRFEETQSGVVLATYRDGDGDGVLARDIDRGIDVECKPPHIITMTAGGVELGFPSGPAPKNPDGSGRRLTRLSDPIRFNRSDMASFSPLGTATPGTVYLTARDRHLVAVRVSQGAGRVRLLYYEAGKERWIRMW
ncbi:MAG: GspH/FimT family pseudopilin [Holophagales bacterium]|nr:GspH/FimT family pseudopilin [Holophagales bacterium]